MQTGWVTSEPLPRLPAPPGVTLLHRVSVKPGHVDRWRPLWDEERALCAEHGFVSHRAFLETPFLRTIAEPKLTWLYSHPDPGAGERALRADPRWDDLTARIAPHRFGNLLVRPVRVEVLTRADAASVAGRIAILRRYSIVGGWSGFLDIWRRIVPVRERHGFRCLVAVADEPADVFTWAFDFAGTWDEFPDAQRDYYSDPARVELRGVFDHMADYAIAPADQLLLDPPPVTGRRAPRGSPRSRRPPRAR